MRNALERGESLEKAKQTFINAGYKSSEVEEAAQKVSGITPIINRSPAPLTAKIPNQKSFKPLAPVTSTALRQPRKQASKLFMVILIILSILILTGAAILGLYWGKWF